MNMKIETKTETDIFLFAKLRAIAAKSGKTVEEVAVDLLKEQTAESSER